MNILGITQQKYLEAFSSYSAVIIAGVTLCILVATLLLLLLK